MKFREITCKSCGADMRIGLNDKTGNCEYCGAYYMVAETEPVHIYNYIGHFKITPLKILIFIVIVLSVAFAIAFPLIWYAQKNNAVLPEEPSAPYVYEDPRAYRFAGQYLVGEDMEAGEYVVYCDPVESSVSVHVAKTPTAGTNSTLNSIYYFTASYRTFVIVEDGQYLTVKNGNIFKLDVFKIEPEDDGGYKEGIELKVGLDIEAGEYLLQNGNNDSLYYYLYGNFVNGKRPPSINPAYNVITSRLYVQLKDGEYIVAKGGKLYPKNAMPSFTLNEDGTYPAGQYKVGTDLDEGDYLLNFNSSGEYAMLTYDTPYFTLTNWVQDGIFTNQTKTLLKAGIVNVFTEYNSCYIYVPDGVLKKAD